MENEEFEKRLDRGKVTVQDDMIQEYKKDPQLFKEDALIDIIMVAFDEIMWQRLLVLKPKTVDEADKIISNVAGSIGDILSDGSYELAAKYAERYLNKEN